MSQLSETPAATLAEDSHRRYWTLALAIAGTALLLVIALYGSTAQSAAKVWANSDTYGYGFFIAPVSLYLIWLRRRALAAYRAEPLPAALLLLLPMGALWLLSDAADVALGRQLALLGTIQVMLLALLGRRLFRALLFPLLYLWLMVPAADFLLPSLMQFTTTMTVALLNLLGVPSHAEGILIVAAGKTYRIVEECAALDFLLGSLAFSLVYANLIYRSLARRAAFVAVTLAAALLANLFRTTGIAFLTHATEGRVDLASDHQLFGWLTFFVTLAVLTVLGLIYAEADADTPGAAALAAPARRGAAVQGPMLATGALAVLLAGLAPAYATYGLDPDPPADQIALCTPEPRQDWKLAPAERAWQAIFPSADARLSQQYSRTRERAEAEVFLAYYWRQRPGAELVNWENRLTDNEVWKWLGGLPRTVEIEGHAVEVTEARLFAKGDRRRLVWHWYWVDGRFTSSPLLAKLLQAKVTLLGGERRSAFIAVTTEELEGTAAARDLLGTLAAKGLALSPALKTSGPGTCL